MSYLPNWNPPFELPSPMKILREEERADEATKEAILRDMEASIKFMEKLLEKDFEERILFGPDGLRGLYDARGTGGWAAKAESRITPADLKRNYTADGFQIDS